VICLYPLLLILFFGFFSVQKGNFFSYAGSNIFYPLIPVVAGFLGGFQLPLAGGILSGRWNTGRTAGKIYGADLLGSCVGAFIGGVFLIPVLGIYGTCWFASFINLIALIGLFSYNLSK